MISYFDFFVLNMMKSRSFRGAVLFISHGTQRVNPPPSGRSTRPDTCGLAVQHTPTEKGPIFFLLVVAKFFSSWLQNVPPRGRKIAA